MSTKKKDDEGKLKKVRMMLDDPYEEKLKKDQDKYLSALQKRLTESSLRPRDYTWYSKSTDVKDFSPQVVIHKGKTNSVEESSKEKKDEEKKSFRVDIPDEELFEIEKSSDTIPEFLEVIPKKNDVSSAVKFTEISSETKDLRQLPKWEPVEDQAESSEPIEKEEVPNQDDNESVEKFEVVEKKVGNEQPLSFEEAEESPSEFFENEVDEEGQSTVWEPINASKKTISLKKKAEIFKEFASLKTINQETAVLLFQHGITSLDDLKHSSVDHLKAIEGLSDHDADRINEEVQRLKNVESLRRIEKELSSEEKKEIAEESVQTASNEEVATYGDYTLYKKEISIGDDNTRVVHFFSKEPPKDSDPAPLPKGYQIKVNRKTGVPFIKKT